MSGVPSTQDILDNKVDLDNYTSVLNGTSTVTMRLGLQVLSVAQAIQSLLVLNPTGIWITATGYAIKDLVEESNNVYIATVAHTSGVFATDLAAGKWALYQLDLLNPNFINGLTVDTNTLFVDALNNRVGIGTVTPANKLDVAGGMVIGSGYASSVTAQTNGLSVQGKILSGGGSSPTSTIAVGVGLFHGETDLFTALQLVSHNDVPGNFSIMSLVKSRGVQGAETIVIDGDCIGRWTSQGYDGADYFSVADILMEVDGVAAANDLPGRLVMRTTPAGSTTLIERLRITNSGQVAIGTSTPDASALFEVQTTTQGFLPPRMTTGQRDAIVSPAVGLVVYNTTLNKLNVYTGSWEVVTSV